MSTLTDRKLLVFKKLLAFRSVALAELVDATFGIHKTLFSGEERVGVGGDRKLDDGILDAFKNFFLVALDRRATDEFNARRGIDEKDFLVFGVLIFFHANAPKSSLISYMTPSFPSIGKMI